MNCFRNDNLYNGLYFKEICVRPQRPKFLKFLLPWRAAIKKAVKKNEIKPLKRSKMLRGKTITPHRIIGL